MKVLGLIVTLGVLGYVLYKFFKKDEPTNNGDSNEGGYTGVNDGVGGELPKDTIQ